MTRNTIKTFVLLAAIGACFIVVGGLLVPRGGAAIGLALGLVVVGGSYWFSDRLAVRAAGAHPVDADDQPELAAIVTESPSGPGCRCRSCSSPPPPNRTPSPPVEARDTRRSA